MRKSEAFCLLEEDIFVFKIKTDNLWCIFITVNQYPDNMVYGTSIPCNGFSFAQYFSFILPFFLMEVEPLEELEGMTTCLLIVWLDSFPSQDCLRVPLESCHVKIDRPTRRGSDR